MGWAAARGELGGGGWILFWILALWQMPHFLAIAWMYRDDYERAGFAMLPRFDVRGRRTAWLSLVCTVLLVGTSLLPGMWGMSGGAYVMGALVLGGVFTWLAVRWVREVTDGGARYLFYASILYLPLLLGLLAMDKR
jgi:protoheme IX farnesyltransferase